MSIGIVHLTAILLYGCSAMLSLKYIRLTVKHGNEEPNFWFYVLSGIVCATFIPLEIAWMLSPSFDVDDQADIIWSLMDIARAIVIILAIGLLNSRFHIRKTDVQ